MSVKNQPILALLFVIILFTAAGSILFASSLPIWGDKHLPHESEKTLPMPSGQQVEQTFIWEHSPLDTAVFQLDTSRPLPEQGSIQLEVDSPTSRQSSTLDVRDIPPSGTAVFTLDQPLKARAGDQGVLRLKLPADTSRIWLKYQIDSSIYDSGKLIYYPNQRKQGDLAFHLRYQRPALGTWPTQFFMSLAILISGIIVASILTNGWRRGILHWPVRYWTKSTSRKRALRSTPPLLSQKRGAVSSKGASRRRVQWRTGTQALIIFLAITTFYGSLLLRPHLWPGPIDFTKEVSYVKSSSEAIKHFAWPLWSHYTCSGMGLLGNPESTTISLSTLFALFTHPELALWITLALEAGLGAAGVFVLSRHLKVSPAGSLLAAIVSSLSTAFAYKIVEGIVMLGGIVAFTPWILFFYLKGEAQRVKPKSHSQQHMPSGLPLGRNPAPRPNTFKQMVTGLWYRRKNTNNHAWHILSGLTLAAVFWRGDVHVILGIIAILVVWTFIESLKTKSYRPLIPLIIIGAVTFLGGAIKVLPYLEQPDLIGENVDPHSVQITAENLWDDIFLKLEPRENQVPVLHGKPEHFGYAGAYLGILPILLALVGLFSKKRYRWHLIIPLILVLITAEGSLYEYVLRHAPPLDALFRMPTRFLLLATILTGILAGIGLDKILSYKKINRPLIKTALATIIIILITINLGLATFTILHTYTRDRTPTQLSTPDQPTLSPHRNFSFDQSRHASVLLSGNHLLPHVCGDQNNPPEFLSTIDQPTLISDHPTTLTPNTITLQNTSGTQDIIIKARYLPAWQVDHARLIPNPDGAIHLITNHKSPDLTTIEYHSPTKFAQQLTALIILTLFTLSICHLKKPVPKNP